MSWVSMRGQSEGFLFLRYEDMIQDTERELAKVARFLKFQPTPERIARAVQLSSADHMRKLEKKEAQQWQLTKNTRQNQPFVRAAKAGNWEDTLPAASVAAIESAWGATMRSLGYTLSKDISADSQASTVTLPR